MKDKGRKKRRKDRRRLGRKEVRMEEKGRESEEIRTKKERDKGSKGRKDG